MKKSLKEMSDAELRKHIEALEKRVYRPLWSPVNKRPDGLHEAIDEKNRRQDLERAEHRNKLAKLRKEECETNKDAEMHNLTIRAIRPQSAHEINN